MEKMEEILEQGTREKKSHSIKKTIKSLTELESKLISMPKKSISHLAVLVSTKVIDSRTITVRRNVNITVNVTRSPTSRTTGERPTIKTKKKRQSKIGAEITTKKK